jgi:AcrR family transcriptional regulator
VSLTFQSRIVNTCDPWQILDVRASDTAATKQRIEGILRASIPVFAERGYRRTSMSNIADAAGMSRPALYQYFTDRSDLFAAAFRLLLEENTDAALEALSANVPLVDRLDGYLQRLHGDPYSDLAATDYGEELMDAHHQFGTEAAAHSKKRAHDGLRKHLQTHTGADRQTRTGMLELLTLSIAGLKQDHPSPGVYRRRLTFLAQTAACALTVP